MLVKKNSKLCITLPVLVMVLNICLCFLLRVMLFTSPEMKMPLQLMFQNTWPRSPQVFFLTFTFGNPCKRLVQPSHCLSACVHMYWQAVIIASQPHQFLLEAPITQKERQIIMTQVRWSLAFACFCFDKRQSRIMPR